MTQKRIYCILKIALIIAPPGPGETGYGPVCLGESALVSADGIAFFAVRFGFFRVGFRFVCQPAGRVRVVVGARGSVSG